MAELNTLSTEELQELKVAKSLQSLDLDSLKQLRDLKSRDSRVMEQKRRDALISHRAAIGRGALEGIEDVGKELLLFTRDVSDALGISDKETTAGLREKFSAEEEQTNKLKFVRENPRSFKTSRFISKTGTEIAGISKAAKAIGAGKGLLSRLGKDAGAVGALSAIQDPGQSDSPLLNRAGSAALGAALGAGAWFSSESAWYSKISKAGT